VWRRKIPSLRRESNPNHGFAQPVASPYTDWAIPAILWRYRLEKKAFMAYPHGDHFFRLFFQGKQRIFS
jgi:hypothetical protein